MDFDLMITSFPKLLNAAVITLKAESLSSELSCSAITKTFALVSITLYPLYLVI